MRYGRAALLLISLLLAASGAQATDKLRVGKAVQVGWTFTICDGAVHA